MVSLGLSIQVMAAPVLVQVVDVNDNDTIVANPNEVIDIYILLDNVGEYYEDLSGYNPPFVLDPEDPDYDPDDPEALEKLKHQIQAIQFVLTYDPHGISAINSVEAFGVTAGSGSLEAWPVRSNIVVDGELYVNLSMNPVDPNDPDWSEDLYEVEANPDLDWNPSEIYSLHESGKVLKINLTVGADASGDYTLTLEEIQQEVPEESLVSLAILNEKDKDTGEDIIPSEIVPGTLRVDGGCPIPWTYHAYPLATCNFWGYAKISGVDVQVGDVIGAFVSDVEVNDGCIGYFEVTENTVSVRGIGEYGLLAANGDDPTTDEKDGATEGDVVTFKILDRSDCEIYCANPQEDSPDEPIWNKDITKNVNFDTIPPPILYEPQVGDEAVYLTWSSVAGASGYKVYRSTTSGVYTDPPIDVGDTLEYEDTTVSNGTTYYYVVTAYQDGCESGYSNEVHATPPFGFHPYPPCHNEFYGSVTIENDPAPEGDIVAVFAPDVDTNDGCIGYFIVGSEGEGVIVSGEGEYGLLTAYGDDPTTDEKDGAYDGDVLTFKIWDASEDIIVECNCVDCGEPITFEGCDTTREVNLACATTFELYLSENWNLISWNVAACFYQDPPGSPTDPLPDGTELINISDLGFDYMADWFTDLLKPCNPDFPDTEIPWRIVQGAHPGGEVAVMDSNVPSRFHTLKYMSAGYGYAIKLKEGTGGGTISLKGFPRLKPDAVLPLSQNWNMVGYLPGIGYYDTTPQPDPLPCNHPEKNKVYATPDCWIHKDPPVVDYVFGSIAGEWRIIQGALPGGEVTVADSAVPSRFWTLHHTSPGDGYYIKLNNDADLTYPDDSCPDATISMSPIAQIVPSRNTSVKPTNLAMFIYGAVSLDGKPAPLGSRITVWNSSGVLIGEGTVDETGEYGFVPIYGDDFTTPELDGAHVGDELIVKVDGHSVSQQSVRWLGDHAVQKVDLEVYTRIIPSASWLGQNYPNPFNPETWLPYALSESAEVTIQIYDIRGSLVRTLHMGRKPAGVYDTKELAGYWDGRNDAGERISSGLYFYKLIAGTFTQIKRMTIIK
jgi:hypothetical protein